MSYEMLLLGAQAASGSYNVYQQNQFNKMGAQIDKNQLDIRLQQEQIATTQQATQATKQLRGTLASQAAIMGARGQAGGGSATAVMNQSVGNYYDDLSALNTNMHFKKNQAKLDKALMDFGVKTKNSINQQNLFGNILDKTSFNSFRAQLGNSKPRNFERELY